MATTEAKLTHEVLRQWPNGLLAVLERIEKVGPGQAGPTARNKALGVISAWIRKAFLSGSNSSLYAPEDVQRLIDWVAWSDRARGMPYQPLPPGLRRITLARHLGISEEQLRALLNSGIISAPRTLCERTIAEGLIRKLDEKAISWAMEPGECTDLADIEIGRSRWYCSFNRAIQAILDGDLRVSRNSNGRRGLSNFCVATGELASLDVPLIPAQQALRQFYRDTRGLVIPRRGML